MDAKFVYVVSWSKVYSSGTIRVCGKQFTDFEEALDYYEFKKDAFCVTSCSLTLNVHIGDIHVAEKLL